MSTTLPNLPALSETPAHTLVDTDITVVNTGTSTGTKADRKATLSELKAYITADHTAEIEAIDARVTAVESIETAVGIFDLAAVSGVGDTYTSLGLSYSIPASTQWSVVAVVNIEVVCSSGSGGNAKGIRLAVTFAGARRFITIPDMFCEGIATYYTGGMIMAMFPAVSGAQTFDVEVKVDSKYNTTINVVSGYAIVQRRQ